MLPVYLSGFGLVSSLGNSLSAGLAQLQTPPPPLPRGVTGLPHTVPYHAIADADPDWTARCMRLIRQVVAEAGFPSGRETGPRCGLYLASSSSFVGALERGDEHFGNLAGFVAAVAAMLEWQGPVMLINSACTSGLNALLEAKVALERETIDEALVIGLELENQLTLAGFAGLQLLSLTRAQPFQKRRDGQILGEAVATVRLSRRPGRWRLSGGAHVLDSSQISSASAVAYRSMLEQSLIQAQWNSAQVDLVKVQASGSVINDAVEAEALHGFFMQSSAQGATKTATPALVSLKPHIGHTLGASGVAEIALLLGMLELGMWPTVGDNDSELKVSLARQSPQLVSRILACILGFGGSHACVAIEAVP